MANSLEHNCDNWDYFYSIWAPCSIEGLLYSQLPLSFHLIGLPEILLQTLAFSLLTVWWVKPKSAYDVTVVDSRRKAVGTQILHAVINASFEYIGYAIGGILIAKLSGVDVGFRVASTSISYKNQLMFIVAFIAKIVSVLYLSQVWPRKKTNALFFSSG